MSETNPTKEQNVGESQRKEKLTRARRLIQEIALKTDALKQVDTVLESAEWYDGEEKMEALLERLGRIVQDALNDPNWRNRPLFDEKPS